MRQIRYVVRLPRFIHTQKEKRGWQLANPLFILVGRAMIEFMTNGFTVLYATRQSSRLMAVIVMIHGVNTKSGGGVPYSDCEGHFKCT